MSINHVSNQVRLKLQQMPDVNAPIIAALNDQARQTFKECRVVITQGVQGLKDVPDFWIKCACLMPSHLTMTHMGSTTSARLDIRANDILED